MIVTVVNKDGIRNVFEHQKNTKEFVQDVMLAVTSGTGFSLNGPRGLIAYGPGTVDRVGFVDDKKEEKK